jgi:flavin-dependent dehydrogenase
VNADVLIVGAGPAGLAAAIELRRLGAGRILVADRSGRPAAFPGTARTSATACATCAG